MRLPQGWKHGVRPKSSHDALPAIGDIVGGYRILGRLGAGGMGQVFRARDDDLERDVALKLLHPKLTFQPRAMSRFRREARLLAAVHHPNIATIFGTFEDGGVRVLVMELVDGETLAQRLDRKGRGAQGRDGQAQRKNANGEQPKRRGIDHLSNSNHDFPPSLMKLFSSCFSSSIESGFEKLNIAAGVPSRLPGEVSLSGGY
ncbi:MAG TPA: protein kinase [Thermoanaerobaculia bacterium]|nr:protein kinase [Thermoanaerobaculia bacterium]